MTFALVTRERHVQFCNGNAIYCCFQVAFWTFARKSKCNALLKRWEKGNKRYLKTQSSKKKNKGSKSWTRISSLPHETETGVSCGGPCISFQSLWWDSEQLIHNMAVVEGKRTFLAHTKARQACCEKKLTRNVPQVFSQVQSYYRLHRNFCWNPLWFRSRSYVLVQLQVTSHRQVLDWYYS